MLLETTCKHSLVPGLSKIIYEEDGCCKLLRFGIFLTCLTGFSYQTWQFLSFYFTNPTYTEAVTTDVGNLILPALSFCNRSPGSRQKYCQDNPSYCEQIQHPFFCHFYSYYCYNSSSLPLPTRVPSLLQRENALYFSFPEVYSRQKKVETLNYTYAKKLNELLPCSSVYFDGYYPEKYQNLFNFPISPDVLPFSEFTVTYDRSDLLHKSYPPTVIFGIHSPLDTQFSDIELRLGSYYDVYLRMEEHRLLPAPYATDCRNYKEEYSTNNHTGPLSKQTCQMFCEIQPYLDECGCFYLPDEWLGIIIPSEFLCNSTENAMCTFDHKRGDGPVNIDACLADCKDDCVKLVYHADIVSRKEVFFHQKIATRINFHFKDTPLTIVSHKPLYELVEVFCYIGGYLGLWLGLCMISAADLLLLTFNNLLASFYKCAVCLLQGNFVQMTKK